MVRTDDGGDTTTHDLGLEPFLGHISLFWFHRRWMLREVGLPSEAIAMCGAKSIEFQEFVRRVESLQRSSLAPSMTFASDGKVVVERLRPMANLQLSYRGLSLLRSVMDLLLGFTAARQQRTNAHRCLDYAWRTRLSTFYFAAMPTRTLQGTL